MDDSARAFILLLLTGGQPPPPDLLLIDRCCANIGDFRDGSRSLLALARKMPDRTLVQVGDDDEG